jgi:hypothetical protein
MIPENNKPKLVPIAQPGRYSVRICKLREEDIGVTSKGDAKVRVLLVTNDNQKINELFYASTDGALKRAAAFVNTATGKRGGLPPKDQAAFAAYIGQAEGKVIAIDVIEVNETWKDGSEHIVKKVSRFASLQEGPAPAWQPKPKAAPAAQPEIGFADDQNPPF